MSQEFKLIKSDFTDKITTLIDTSSKHDNSINFNSKKLSIIETTVESQINDLNFKANKLKDQVNENYADLTTYKNIQAESNTKLENMVTKKVIEMSVLMTKKFKDLPKTVTECILNQFSDLNCLTLQKFNNVIEFLNDFETRINKLNRDISGDGGVFDKNKEL